MYPILVFIEIIKFIRDRIKDQRNPPPVKDYIPFKSKDGKDDYISITENGKEIGKYGVYLWTDEDLARVHKH